MDRKQLVQAILTEAAGFARFRPLSPVNRNLQGEAMALHLMCLHPEGITPGEMAELMNVSAPRVAAVLDRLADKGLALRQPSPTDRRRIIAVPTEKGLLQEAENASHVILHTEQLLSVLDDGELESLAVILHKLRAAGCCKEETKC